MVIAAARAVAQPSHPAVTHGLVNGVATSGRWRCHRRLSLGAQKDILRKERRSFLIRKLKAPFGMP